MQEVLMAIAKTIVLPISLIRRDGQTQPRDGMSEYILTDYVAALADGVQFPPVDVMFDGTHYWLFDGFHRVETYLRSGRTAISARCYDGTLEEAQWRSYAANKMHGLRRSTADKERSIRLALKHSWAVAMSNVAIARHLGVDDKTVAKYRSEMESSEEIPQVTHRLGRDGRTYSVALIGNRPAISAPPINYPVLASPTIDLERQRRYIETPTGQAEIAKRRLESLKDSIKEMQYSLGAMASIPEAPVLLTELIQWIEAKIEETFPACVLESQANPVIAENIALRKKIEEQNERIASLERALRSKGAVSRNVVAVTSGELERM